MKYQPGMSVEVCSFEIGFEGGWFEAIIQFCKEDYCEVMYEKFKTEDGDQSEDDDEPLVEKTDYSLLRPRPPHSNVRNWAIGDLVEAYENDAWWRGIVMRVLPSQQYYVEFPESKSDNVFHQSNLRVRQDWEKETWYVPSPSSLAGKRPKNFPAKFPVAKGLLCRDSRMDIDNKQYPTSVAGSCTDIVHSSLEQKDRTGHATEYEQLPDEMTHRLEEEAYRSVLRVFSARETLTWRRFDLLTDLRIELHITNEEHLLERKKLKTSC